MFYKVLLALGLTTVRVMAQVRVPQAANKDLIELLTHENAMAGVSAADKTKVRAQIPEACRKLLEGGNACPFRQADLSSPQGIDGRQESQCVDRTLSVCQVDMDALLDSSRAYVANRQDGKAHEAFKDQSTRLTCLIATAWWGPLSSWSPRKRIQALAHLITANPALHQFAMLVAPGKPGAGLLREFDLPAGGEPHKESSDDGQKGSLRTAKRSLLISGNLNPLKTNLNRRVSPLDAVMSVIFTAVMGLIYFLFGTLLLSFSFPRIF